MSQETKLIGLTEERLHALFGDDLLSSIDEGLVADLQRYEKHRTMESTI